MTPRATPSLEALTLTPIGVVRSCFRSRYGVPRQPGLAPHACATLKLRDDHRMRTSLRGIEGSSHLWVLYVFHDAGARDWRPSVRAPRLGGEEKVGVLATRSMHRPNPIGMSVVALDAVRVDARGGPELDVHGVDMLDGSPVLDVKPYLPYADAVRGATVAWAAAPIVRHRVALTRAAREVLARYEAVHPGVTALVRELLSLDPRPAFQQRQHPMGDAMSVGRRYGFTLYTLDVRWEMTSYGARIDEVLVTNGSTEESNLPRDAERLRHRF